MVIFEDQIASLRGTKDDVREVAAGYECGIGLEIHRYQENDILEAYEMVSTRLKSKNVRADGKNPFAPVLRWTALCTKFF